MQQHQLLNLHFHMTTSKNRAPLYPNVGPSLALDEAMNNGVGEPSNDDTHKNFGEKFGA